MENSIKKTIRQHREWLRKNGDRIFDRDAQYLREDIKEGSAQAFQQIPDSLDALGTYFGIRGISEVVDGYSEGWRHLSAAIDFHAWGIKIRANSFSRQTELGVSATNLTNYVSRAACIVCVSEKWSASVLELLQRIDLDPDSVDQSYWGQRRFEPFVLACCGILERKSPNTALPKRDDDAYSRLLSVWDDVAELEAALKAICEYHCQNMDDTGGDWDPEFKLPPFDLLPCEIMLVKRVRDQFGLTTPVVSHPLASALGLKTASVPAYTEHELLQEVASAFSRLDCNGL